MLKSVLGSVLGLASLAGLLSNLIVLWPVFSLAFVSAKNPIYVIAYVNILIDVLCILITLVYLVPSIILDRELFTESWFDISGSIFMFTWYSSSLTQNIMSINRLIMVCMKRVASHITKNLVLSTFACLLPLSLLLTCLAQFQLPCCQVIFDHRILSITYRNSTQQNYANYYIDMPLNIITTLIWIICYTQIFVSIHKSKICIVPTAQSLMQRNRELKYSVYFAAISVFYTTSWISFRIIPQVSQNNVPNYWHIITILSVILYSSSNSLIFLFFNKEVRYLLQFRKKHIPTITIYRTAHNLTLSTVSAN